MQLGMIGLGRMGAGMSRRLLRAGHEVVAHDVHREVVDALVENGAIAAYELDDLVGALTPPRHLWLMVPAAFTQPTIDRLVPLLAPGDAIVDGGNTDWRDDIARGESLDVDELHYVDVGVSGGVWGEARGFCQMIGGDPEVVARLRPVFEALAPGVGTAPRTPGRDGEPTAAEQGWLHCGGHGAGHFVKMVHNGIEYGLMSAYAEGLALLSAAGDGAQQRAADAETAPLSHPHFYEYTFDLPDIVELWRRGSVIPSWLLDLLATALVESPDLHEFGGRVSDSGEGRWTAEAAVALGVPTPVLTSALQARFATQGRGLFAGKAQSALRKQFGGHAEKPPTGEG